jgi:hypothetical protein
MLCATFASAASDPPRLFDFKSDRSLDRLRGIQSQLDSWYDSQTETVRSGVLTADQVAHSFWQAHRDSFDFLLHQSHVIVLNMLNRLEIETQLLISDPETVEDLIEFDISPLVNFIQSHQRLSAIMMKSKLFLPLRKRIKNHYANLLFVPLSVRSQYLIFARKWNTTIQELKKNESFVVPSHLAWEICAKLSNYQAIWLDFFMSNLKHSIHEVAAVMFSSRSFFTFESANYL